MRASIVLFGLAALLTGCGSGMGDTFLDVAPNPSVVRVGERLTLTAQPSLDLVDEPEWSTQEIQGGAFLRNKGLSVTYLAPQTEGVYHLVMTSRGSDGAPVRQLHEIRVLPVIHVTPESAKLLPGESLQLSTRVRGSSNQSVAWSIEEPDGGQISQAGLYTAPPRPGIYHLVASQNEATARSTVRVEPQSAP